MKFSNKIIALQESPIRKLATYAKTASDKGIHVYHLNIGQPDIETPDIYLSEIKSYDESIIKYAPSKGMPALLTAIKTYYEHFDIKINEDDVIVTSGASEAILFAISVICNARDDILIPEPFYTNTVNFFNQLSVNAIPIPTDESNGYQLPDKKVIEQLITAKTKAIFITNPNNPTGTVYGMEELRLIKDLAIEHDLFVIADEVYRTITFDGVTSHSFLTFDDLKEQLIIMDSVSKRYSSCGARIGALISKNKDFIYYAMKLAQARLSVSTLSQLGATKLYQIEPSYYQEIARVYEQRRNVMIDQLSHIEGVTYAIPKGAFYLLVSLPIEDTEVFAKWLLTDFNDQGETIFITPANDFYNHSTKGKHKIRLAFVNHEDTLKRAIAILRIALEKYLKL